MTEADWQSSTDPSPMVAFLQNGGAASDRKFGLFGCACARRVLPFLSNVRLARLVDAAERAADGEASGEVAALVEELRVGVVRPEVEHDGRAGVMGATVASPSDKLFRNAFFWLAKVAAWGAAPNATDDPDYWSTPYITAWRAAWSSEGAAQASVLRDVVGTRSGSRSSSPSC